VSSRETALEQLAGRRFDVLVVGGGIVGAGIAAQAAHLGLAVALVERGDFGGATSSGSSKLVHGGLRYLRLGDLRLVRESHQERRALLRVVAPHLVRRLPFLLPLYRDGPFRPLTIRAGLGLYSLLAGDRVGGLVDPARARRSVPNLRVDGLRGCGVYEDAWTNDARLCLANVRAAAETGAAVLNYAEVTSLRIAGGEVAGAEVRDRETGASVSVEARAVVNATGPWVDRLRLLESPAARPSVTLSKGVHALVPQPPGWSAALTIPQDDVRVSFAVPWAGSLLLGTTDEPYEGEPDRVEPTAADLSQVLAEAGRALEEDVVAPERVHSTFAALRVLPGVEGDTARTRRETVVDRGPAGMLTVAGGKLTTYRRIALDVLERLRPQLGLHRLDRAPWPLPGAALRSARLPAELPPNARANLLHLYGSLAPEVLEPAAEDPSLLEPIADARRRTSCAAAPCSRSAGTSTPRSRPGSRSCSVPPRCRTSPAGGGASWSRSAAASARGGARARPASASSPRACAPPSAPPVAARRGARQPARGSAAGSARPGRPPAEPAPPLRARAASAHP
jgi:glycerol-3-phosphate dehydrogenase